MFNLFSWLSGLGKSDKSQRDRVLQLWEEIEECEQTYNHNKNLGDKMLAQADEVDNLKLPFAEKMARKEMCFKLAKDNLDKADFYNQRMTDLSAELKLAIENVRR